MPPKDQCPFCQLIANPDQLLLVGETDNFYAWLEINPRARGHTMIVPREHKESVLDFSPEEYQEAMKLTRMVIEKAEKGLGADGASVTVNIGEAGGQMVPHAYIQVFPRFEDDENAGTPTGAIFPQQEELQQDLEGTHESMASVSVNFETETREPHPESKKHKSSRASRLVDRNEMERQTDDTGDEEKEEAPEPDPEELLEDGIDQGDDGSAGKEGDEEAENEPRGEGHWDGKSFEWR